MQSHHITAGRGSPTYQPPHPQVGHCPFTILGRGEGSMFSRSTFLVVCREITRERGVMGSKNLYLKSFQEYNWLHH